MVRPKQFSEKADNIDELVAKYFTAYKSKIIRDMKTEDLTAIVQSTIESNLRIILWSLIPMRQ